MAKVELHDLVILLPGIMGSALTKRKAGREVPVWAVSGQALWKALTSLGDNLQDLQVPAHDPRKDVPDTPLRAASLVNDFHGVFGFWRIDGYDTTLKAFIDKFEVRVDTPDGNIANANLIAFPYDWRLSNRIAANALKDLVKRRLQPFRDATKNPMAKVILVAHSMGGLVSRYWLEVHEGWRDCRALVTFGTPYRGALDALDYLANGFKKTKFNVTLVDLSKVVRSCPGAYELLPVYNVLKVGNKTWVEPADADSLPADINRDYLLAARAFHSEIENAVAANRRDTDYLSAPYPIFPVVGVHQTTLNSAVQDGDKWVPSELRPDWLDKGQEGGDGTVPRYSASPADRPDDMREIYFAERHASLQGNDHVLTNLAQRVMQLQMRRFKPLEGGIEQPVESISLQVDPLFLPGEPVELFVDAAGVERFGPPRARITARGADLEARVLSFVKFADHWELNLGALPAGQYALTVEPTLGGPNAPTPIHEVIEVAA
jgi:pimeloyl-ACP methyl ester carboxylesterase